MKAPESIVARRKKPRPSHTTQHVKRLEARRHRTRGFLAGSAYVRDAKAENAGVVGKGQAVVHPLIRLLALQQRSHALS